MGKPKRFTPGQQVICAMNTDQIKVKWGVEPEHGINKALIPKYNEEYTIRDYGRYKLKQWWVRIVGMPDNFFYQESMFAPLLPDSVIKELIEETLIVEA